MKPAYLVGIGANDIQIIGMIFESFVKGVNWCRANLNERWNDPENSINHRVMTHVYDCSEESIRRVFTRYYDGCGECFELRLEEVSDYATPLVPWDLD